jgi:hypothetical protein
LPIDVQFTIEQLGWLEPMGMQYCSQALPMLSMQASVAAQSA